MKYIKLTCTVIIIHFQGHTVNTLESAEKSNGYIINEIQQFANRESKTNGR